MCPTVPRLPPTSGNLMSLDRMVFDLAKNDGEVALLPAVAVAERSAALTIVNSEPTAPRIAARARGEVFMTIMFM